ncbi:hypothetical protein [Methylobacterium sp. WL120]|uniref:hypothetical protein n=1 Tax=Methylobacterium sp. WL120 TaxID=2603887 RepID=UPI0011C852E8|nr:hypothetical protein [Methylobacterium sp. WL120]TXM70733.1 hypothetical protein FV229_01905 [Methylobacterium sp. WL120]
MTALVEAGLAEGDAVAPNLIGRLRDLERFVIEAGGDRQSLQVIASGRRLLEIRSMSNPPPSSTITPPTDRSS